jgi:hypothetical protein
VKRARKEYWKCGNLPDAMGPRFVCTITGQSNSVHKQLLLGQLEGAKLIGYKVYGTSAWDLKLPIYWRCLE